MVMDINQLQIKVSELELLITDLQNELRRAQESSVPHILGQLRLREILLLYVGDNKNDELGERLAQEYGTEISNLIIKNIFMLNNAPIPDSGRETMRTAFNHGNCRW